MDREELERRYWIFMYRQAVADGATALRQGDKGHWKLAYLAYETGHGEYEGEDGDSALECWAADVEEAAGRPFDRATAERYRWAWRAFYLHQTDRPTFPDSFWTYDECGEPPAPAEDDLSEAVEPIIERFDRLEARLAGIKHTLQEMNE